ncbi:MAG: hypothetical protein U9P68_12880 [Pseudomonadota bacterium]|nr:hypothetical protein [Pseudomonadota bacterium]
MKRILLAGAAIATLGAAAWAMDDDKRHTRIHVEDGHSVVMNGGGHGPVVELRGDNGERTIHMERDGESTTIRINGQTVEIADGEVTVDGQRVEVGRDGMIIVDGGEIRVVENDFDIEFDTEFAAHMAERAEHLARMHEDFAGNFVFEFDAEGLEADVMASLEETLADLENRDFHHSGDWEDLSPEEREEVREALAEAREEVREAMQEVRREVAGLEREMAGERRRVRVELRNAQREMARAEREMARAERDVARERRHVEIRRRDAEANAADAARHHVRIHRERLDGDAAGDRRDVRIEEDDDGRRRVWIDGQEQTGDDLTRWLNQLETDRLAGAQDGRIHRRVERLHLDGEDDRRVIELDGGNRVVILERHEVEDHD